MATKDTNSLGIVGSIVSQLPTLNEKEKKYVSAGSLASNQLNDIINTNSDLRKSATTSANQQSNSKGLLNTAGAVGSAQKAVIDSATPIALANAQAYQASDQLRQQGDINTGMEKLRQQGNIDLQNLQNKFTRQLETMRYNRQDQQLLTAMINTQTTALMNQIGNLLGNTDIEMSDKVTKWMSNFMESSWKSASEIFNIPIEVK